jgi:tRNA G18 (ribose-2'-O)-methylase SpoU
MNDLDAIVEIPMYGAKNSLNIAACAPVVLYEVLRQWNLPKLE